MWPRWLQEIDLLLPLRAQFVLWGNIRDRYLVRDEGPSPASAELCSMHDCLWLALSRRGYECMVTYDPIDGLGVYPEEPDALDAAGKIIGSSLAEGRSPIPLDRLSEILMNVVEARDLRAAFVIDYASRLVEDPNNLTPEQQRFFAFCEKLSHSARPAMRGGERALYNPVIWLVTGERDLPDWLRQSGSLPSLCRTWPTGTKLLG